MKKLASFTVLLLLASCTPGITSKLTTDKKLKELSENEAVHLLAPSTPLDKLYADKLLPVGELKVGDFTTAKENCELDGALKRLTQEARKVGADVIHIEKASPPNAANRCYHVKAKAYKTNTDDVAAEIGALAETQNSGKTLGSSDKAVIHFYRPKNAGAVLVGAKIAVNDTFIGRLRSGEYMSYDLTDFGPTDIEARTESPDNITIDVQAGHEYYVQCRMRLGVMVGRPYLLSQPALIGKIEWEEILENGKEYVR